MWCHWSLHIWFPIYIVTACLSVTASSYCPSNVCSYLLSLGPNYGKSQMHQNGPKMPLNAARQQVLQIRWTTTCDPQFLSRFSPRSPIFQITEVFGFSIGYNPGYNGKFEIFEKKKTLKIRKSKFQKSPMQFCEDQREENSGEVWKHISAICRRSSVLKFFTPSVPR